MKVTKEKNLLFANQPKPVLSKDVTAQVPSKNAIRKFDYESDVEFNLFLPTTEKPQVDFIREENNAKIKVTNFKLGQHTFPPNIRSVGVPSLGKNVRTLTEPPITTASLPDHLDLKPVPSEIPKELRTPPFFKVQPSQTEKIGNQPTASNQTTTGNQATTVFLPDDRRVFSDTSYPWSTIGRVDTPLGSGTGVMVGPKHMLTVSHVIQWLDNNQAGWVQFRPAYFAPSAPFGEAWGVTTYWKLKVVNNGGIDGTEEMFDYVVVVLDRNIGNDSTGWMGSKSYTDAWDGNPYWSHVGYPTDLTAANKPTFQNTISLDGHSWEDDAHESMDHRGDVWPGQSGGPFFAWWADGWPYVVAVQSWQNSSFNGTSGGADLVDLINRARTEHP